MILDPELQRTLRGRHILLVEDDYFIAQEFHDWLVEIGFDVIGPFSSIGEPIALIETNAPETALDAAVLDVNLGMHENLGTQTVYPLARRLLMSRIPILFVTAYAPENIDPEFRAVPRLSKPLTARQLQQTVARLFLPEDADSFHRRNGGRGLSAG